MRFHTTAMAIGLALALPAAASADAITLGALPPLPGYPIPITVSTSTQTSSLLAFVYAAPATFGCAPSAQFESLAPGGMPLTVGYPVATGDSSFDLSFTAPSPGAYVLCAYLAAGA